MTTADAVASTRSRLAKVDALADLLRRLEPDEIAPAVGFLVGKPRQGRVGVGWRGMSAAMGESAAEPTLSVGDLDELLDRLATTSGSGSAGERAGALRELTARATEREQGFISRALLGDMRTGALEGVLTDAIARAADRPGDVGAPRGDALGRPRRDRPARTHGHRGRARRRRARGRSPGAADARGHRPERGRRDRDDGRGIRRIQARRRAHPGAPRRRRRAGVHAQPRRHHRTDFPRSSRWCGGCRCAT